jgi:hypothetical protein
LIWELVSGAFPFDQSNEVFEGKEAEQIRQRVATGSLPWVDAAPTEPLLIRVAQLVTRCCSHRPNVRPSAADIAHSLFEIQESAAVNIGPSPSLNEGVMSTVSEFLDKVDKTGEKPATEQLDANLTEELYGFVAQNDPVACFLYGSAVWCNLIEPDDELDPLILAAGVNYQKGIYY